MNGPTFGSRCADVAFLHPCPAFGPRQRPFLCFRNNLFDPQKDRRFRDARIKPSELGVEVTANLSSRPFSIRRRRLSLAISKEQKQQQVPDVQVPDVQVPDVQARSEPRAVLRRTGMNSPMVLSKEMRDFLGQEIMARSQVITGISKYIREHNLYVKGNRTRFVADDFLFHLLGVSGDHPMLHLQKLVSKHLINPREVGPEFEARSQLIFETYLKERGAVDSKLAPRTKDPRGQNSIKKQKELQAKGMGMYAEVVIDPCLQPLCDGQEKMSRPQILKAVWKYIKSNNLQDPTNRRLITVDVGLRDGLQISDATSIDCFHIGRYLWKLCKDQKKKETVHIL